MHFGVAIGTTLDLSWICLVISCRLTACESWSGLGVLREGWSKGILSNEPPFTLDKSWDRLCGAKVNWDPLGQFEEHCWREWAFVREILIRLYGFGQVFRWVSSEGGAVRVAPSRRKPGEACACLRAQRRGCGADCSRARSFDCRFLQLFANLQGQPGETTFLR